MSPALSPTPFGLSLSKAYPSFPALGKEEGEGFDKLSPNGVWNELRVC